MSRTMIKNALRRLLYRESLTPYEFWKRTGIGQNTAYRLCNDPDSSPTKRIMDKIHEVFGWVPGDYLISDDDWDRWVKSLPPSQRSEVLSQAKSYGGKTADGRKSDAKPVNVIALRGGEDAKPA